MKITVIPFLASLMLACTSLQAQDAIQQNTAPPRWTQLTDSVGHVIGLREDQQEGWKQRNESWNKQYQALGDTPESKPDYIKLHSAREFDLKGFLTDGQYDKWKELNHKSRRMFPNNPPGTNGVPDR